MRWLVFLLIAANIAIYLWGVQREWVVSTDSDPRYRQIGEIILLTKADIEDLVAKQLLEKEKSENAKVTTDQQPTIELDSPELPAELIQDEPTSEAQADTEISSVTNIETAPPEEAIPVKEPTQVTNTLASFNENELENDGEQTETEEPPMIDKSDRIEAPLQEQAEENNDAKPEAAVVSETRCWTLGPMAQRQAADNFLKAVADKVISAKVREGTEQIITGYWVVLPPYESASAANKVVEQLKARDVIDVQRFYQGEYQNGVSLGIYNRRHNAEKRKAQIEAKGFFPEVVPRYKEVPNYWTDFISQGEVNADMNIPSSYPDSVLTEQQCQAAPNL